ncbi:MAG: molybdate ABC transporter substrate-binding protein [Planctomycetales bacterium]|nr:molybdate ABC transporter substrate-binding protein [Planctomycetales bacterium]
MPINSRSGRINSSYVTLVGAVGLLAILGFMLRQLASPPTSLSNRNDTVASTSDESNKEDIADSNADRGVHELLLHCAAGTRAPIEKVVAAYREDYGVAVQLNYGGSNTLLSQIEVSHTGDLFLSADESYTDAAVERGLVREVLPLATIRPVIAVKRGNPKQIATLSDLLRDDVVVALGNPDQAAIGKMTRELLTASGDWQALESHVRKSGVFKPTVPEVANDIKLGSADAGIVWNTTVAMYDELAAIDVDELASGGSQVTIGVLTSSTAPTEALRFARYLAARDKGLAYLTDAGYEVIDGDKWAAVPEITFYCGAVNRRAVDQVIAGFMQREGVRVNTVYNGCGILTAQMRTIPDQNTASGFPDTYMACDRFYLNSVADWFQDDIDISDTEVVIAVPKGNPGDVHGLKDLLKPGVRISVGQPDQCTIGVLTRQLLESEGIYDEVMEHVVTQTASSAMLLPTVSTGSVDATFAYLTDTKAEADKVDTIRLNTDAAKAVQPFAIARSSDFKQLSRRLLATIKASRAAFEDAGFHFRLPDVEASQP